MFKNAAHALAASCSASFLGLAPLPPAAIVVGISGCSSTDVASERTMTSLSGTSVTGSGDTTGSATSGGSGGASSGATSGSTSATSSGSGGAGGVAGRGGAAGSAGSGGPRDAGTDGAGCAAGADPLKTGTARVDAYDCVLIELAAKYAHPNPMMVKAQVQQESSFNVLATSMDSPCGIQAGWTDAESKSFGLVQVTPACGEARSALLPNGHPNLTTDMQSPLWASSVFNPNLNLGEGYNTITTMLRALEAKYAGCTEAQYVLMSAGAFNSGTGAVLGCNMFNARAQSYVDAVLGHYHGFARSAGWPDPY
jgi:Transglycosylase SLT domain